MVDFNNIKIPTSVIVGFIVGVLIGIIVGIINKGFFLEIIIRSTLSGMIMGGILLLIEKLLRKYTPEIFEEEERKGFDVKEENDNITFEELYGGNQDERKDEGIEEERFNEPPYTENTEEITQGISEETAFNDFTPKTQETETNEFSNNDDEEFIEEPVPTFSPTDFKKVDLTSGELGVTKESKGGMTNEFIIPPKGKDSKPIPRDYQKLAQIIRTKLHEEK
jgi:hypothetical protein